MNYSETTKAIIQNNLNIVSKYCTICTSAFVYARWTFCSYVP